MQATDLVEMAKIERVKARYVRAGDVRDWELLASTLAEDVDAAYGNGLAFTSAEDFINTMKRTTDDSRITVHCLHQPEIEVHGDTATGRWLLTYRAVRKDEQTLVEGAAHYADEYRRDAEGQWRIARTRMNRLYEIVSPWSATPGLTLTADHLVPAVHGVEDLSHEQR